LLQTTHNKGNRSARLRLDASPLIASSVSVLAALLITALTLATVSGCGGSDHPETSPVSGVVSLDGVPLAGASVTFIRAGAAVFSTGLTNHQGEYALTTFKPDDGAIVGNNIVTVTMPAIPQQKQQQAPDSPMNAEYFDLLRESQSEAPKAKLPAFYADPQTSGLLIHVTPGENVHDIELKSTN